MSRFLVGKLAAAGVTGMLLIGTGLAFAGDLPGPAQNAAHTILAKVGINVPDTGPTSQDQLYMASVRPTPPAREGLPGRRTMR